MESLQHGDFKRQDIRARFIRHVKSSTGLQAEPRPPHLHICNDCGPEKAYLDSDSKKGYHSLNRYERTLNAMRRHPRPSNLRWADIESLLLYLGAGVREGKGSAISVTLNGKTAYFHRPHPDDKADKGAIVTALRLLEEAGINRVRHSRGPNKPTRGGGG